MEVLVLLLLAIPVLALVGTVLGIVALRRIRGLELRLHRLEQTTAPHGLQQAAPATATVAEEQPVVDAAPASPTEVPVPAAGPPAVSDLPPSPPPLEAAPPLDVTPAPAPTAPAPEVRERAPRPPQPPRPPQGFSWEQWIGVRGAAAVGGVVLAVAALLFFQYSIERGLISPTLRVILGVVAGVAAIFASEWLRRRQQEAAANALAGAGAVTLYAAVWAARILYQLLGALPAFAMMALVTVACGLLASRRRSLFIAVLGLTGGFATPLLVGADADQPVMLFAYVLLLDGGLLWLARQRRWPLLAVLSLAGTALHQALWILGAMDAERVLLGLAVLAVFAGAFLLLGRQDEEEPRLWRLTRAGGIVLPLAFCLVFAGRADLGEHLLPVGLLLGLLSACAMWLSRREGLGGLAPVAAAFVVGVVSLWFLSHRHDGPLLWEAVAVTAGLSALFLGARLLWVAAASSPPAELAVVITAAGQLAVLVVAAAAAPGAAPWPWLVAWAAQATVLVAVGVTPRIAPVQLAAGVLPAAGLFVFAAAHEGSAGFPDPSMYAALAAAMAVLFQLPGLLHRQPTSRRWGDHAAAATALALMPAISVLFATAPERAVLSNATLLLAGALVALAATRLRAGAWLAAAVVATAAFHSLWTFVEHSVRETEALPLGALGVQAAAVLLFTLWPAVSGPGFARSRIAWIAAAAAGPLWFMSLRTQWIEHFGDQAIAVLPILLAVLSLAAALRARAVSAAELPVRSTALAWLLAVSLCFVSVAIPLQLDKEWITIGWALNGLAVIALWRRLPHPGLRLLGLALLAATTARLVANPEVLRYHHAGASQGLGWLLYTYLVPAACLVLSGRLLARGEAARAGVASRQLPAAAACGLAAIAVVFVWINLSIADIFSTSGQLTISFERLPARDLSTSIAWAVYAVLLLSIGIRLDSATLRWLSLGLLLATIAKVFLHDLGKLQDLYRVASLLGLAVSLIVVSLVYQRFVLRRRPHPEDS